MRRRLRLLVVASLCAAGIVSPFAVTPVQALDVTVSNLADSGPNSLRSALLNIETFGSSNAAIVNKISFDASLSGTIELESNLPTMTKPLRIEGPGSSVLTIDGNGNRLFVVQDTPIFAIEGLTVRGGRVSGGGAIRGFGSVIDVVDSVLTQNLASSSGGAIYAVGGSVVTVTRTTISDNFATAGGAVRVDDSLLTILDSVVSRNGSDSSGALLLTLTDNAAAGEVRLERTEVSDNESGGTAAIDAHRVTAVDSVITRNASRGTRPAIEIPARGSLTLIRSTVSHSQGGPAISALERSDVQIIASSIVNNLNRATGPAAISAASALVDIISSTIAGNTSASGDAAALLMTSSPFSSVDSEVTITGSTIADSLEFDAVGGFGVPQHSVEVADTIFAGEFVTGSGVDVTATHSIFGGEVASVQPRLSNTLTNTDPVLGAVGDNGGPTVTMLPQQGSPVIDAGDPNSGRVADQRGHPIPAGAGPDIGAVEFQGGSISFDLDAVSVTEGETARLSISRTGGTDPIAVSLADIAGSASPALDYVAVDAEVSWGQGDQAAKSVDVRTLVDGIDDDRESFQVVITTAPGAVVGRPSAATVTVRDALPAARFVQSVAPARLFDSRAQGKTVDGRFEAIGRLPGGEEVEVPIAGRGAIPASARAGVLNVTAVAPDRVGFATVYPCGERPLASSLNFVGVGALGNEVITGLDDEGSVCVFVSTGAHVTIDAVGYVPVNSPYEALTPARLLDTRPGQATIDAASSGEGRRSAGSRYELDVTGRGGVPGGAEVVVVNITSVGPMSVGFVTVDPCDDPLPLASSLNVAAGVNRGNEIVTSLSDDGTICLFTSGEMHLTVDVVGWLPPGPAYSPVSPARLVDTRAGKSTVDGVLAGEGRVGDDTTRRIPVAGRAGVDAGATAVVINLTAINPSGIGYVTVWNCEDDQPLASSLNYRPGVNGGNEVVAGLNAAGELCVYSFVATDLTVDIVGASI